MWNILLGITGSIASVLHDKLEKRLSEAFGSVRVISTQDRQDVQLWTKGTPINHIANRNWASAFVVAPLSANTLAKFVHGLCDNEVTDTYRAWDFTKPVIVAPAMNTFMWDNPITAQHIRELRAKIVGPVTKTLACGDTGVGAMAHIDEVVAAVAVSLDWCKPIHDFTLPVGPGEFGFERSRGRHTGVDLYCKEGTMVSAVEGGRLVHYGQFTGQEGYWNDTWGMIVEGPSGCVVYGELQHETGWRVGDIIKKNQRVGKVAQVLKEGMERPDIPNHSLSMLHLELWEPGLREFKDWETGIKDPTPYLKTAL